MLFQATGARSDRWGFVHGSAAHAALGILIAGLALAALAAQRRPSLQLEAAAAEQASAQDGSAAHGAAAGDPGERRPEASTVPSLPGRSRSALEPEVRSQEPGATFGAPASRATVRALRDGARVELNQALPEDLILLPGIGPKLAQRIVEERARRGGFAAVDELLAVRGMGPKTLAKVRDLLEVKPRAAPLRADRPGTKASGPP